MKKGTEAPLFENGAVLKSVGGPVEALLRMDVQINVLGGPDRACELGHQRLVRLPGNHLW